jgi:hypothetical protein
VIRSGQLSENGFFSTDYSVQHYIMTILFWWLVISSELCIHVFDEVALPGRRVFGFSKCTASYGRVCAWTPNV